MKSPYLRWFVLLITTWLIVITVMFSSPIHRMMHKYGFIQQIEIREDCLTLEEYKREHGIIYSDPAYRKDHRQEHLN